jgi:hypothetical protein
MIRGVKGSKIIAKTFKFDGEKIKNKLEYQGRGKAWEEGFLNYRDYIILLSCIQ